MKAFLKFDDLNKASSFCVDAAKHGFQLHPGLDWSIGWYVETDFSDERVTLLMHAFVGEMCSKLPEPPAEEKQLPLPGFVKWGNADLDQVLLKDWIRLCELANRVTIEMETAKFTDQYEDCLGAMEAYDAFYTRLMYKPVT